jgi:hypothetical protein
MRQDRPFDPEPTRKRLEVALKPLLDWYEKTEREQRALDDSLTRLRYQDLQRRKKMERAEQRIRILRMFFGRVALFFRR